MVPLLQYLSVYRIRLNKKAVILCISNRYGWFFMSIKASSKGNHVDSYFLGLLRLYLLCFRLKGFGFRFVKVKNSVYTKLDFTHRVIIVPLIGNKVRYKHKYKFKI